MSETETVATTQGATDTRQFGPALAQSAHVRVSVKDGILFDPRVGFPQQPPVKKDFKPAHESRITQGRILDDNAKESRTYSKKEDRTVWTSQREFPDYLRLEQGEPDTYAIINNR